MDRVSKVINIILNADKPVTIDTIAEELGVSNKTIRNELVKAEENINNMGMSINKKPGVGISIEGPEDKKAALMDKVKNNTRNVDPYSQEARRDYILKRLFMSKSNITMKELADELYVSRVTIHKDIESVEAWLENFNLKLMKKTNYGIEIKGEEEAFRNAIASLIVSDKNYDELKELLYRDYGGKIDYKTIIKLKELINIDYRQLEKVVLNAEEKLKFKFSDEAFISLVIHLAISIKRLKDGKDIHLSKEILSGLREKEEYKIAREMAEEIDNFFKVRLPEPEVGYILLHILGTKMQQNSMEAININLEDESNSDLAVIMSKEIINIAERALSMNFNRDNYLLNGLILHLRPTINRLKYGLTLRNPILQQIKDNYSEIYGAAWMTSIVFERYLGVKIQEEEIGYIALHIGAAVERNKNPLRALVVCASGIGTSQLLAARLERSFRQIEIKNVVSSISINEENMEDIDLIISTVPIEASKPVLNISPLLTQNDIKKIEYFIESADEDIKIKSIDKFNLLEEELIIRRCPLKTKKDVINEMCMDLAQRGYVDEHYAEEVFKREALGLTAVGRGVAIPHGSPEFVKESKIAAAILSEPINWGQEKVDIIFMICISKEDLRKSRSIFRNLYNIIDSEEALSSLRRAESRLQILKVLEGMGNVN